MISLAITVKDKDIQPKMLVEEVEVVVTTPRPLAVELPAHSLSKSRTNPLSLWSTTKQAHLVGVEVLPEAEEQAVEALVTVLVLLPGVVVVALLVDEVEVAAREVAAEAGEIGRRSVI